MATIRAFDTGATRDVDDNKLDYEGALSPQVLERFVAYMHKHRVQKNGEARTADNWQKGMPLDAFMKSGLRHMIDLWLMHRLDVDKLTRPDGETVTLEDALGGILFNTQGYWFETIRKEAYRASIHGDPPAD